MKKVLFLPTLALLLGACTYSAKPSATTPTYTPTATATVAVPSTNVPTKLTLYFAETNNSGQKGTAVLEETGGKVKVTLTMTGTKYTAAQPAHIHVGVCPGVGAVKWPLTSVMNGKSVTVLDVTMADLAGAGPLAINVHKSAAEASVYTSCTPLTW
jgi:hypothetical protein